MADREQALLDLLRQLSDELTGRDVAKVSFGLSSLLTIAAAVGAALAALKGNDPVLFVSAGLTAVGMIGRIGQAIVLQAKSAARRVLPFIDALARAGDGG